MNVKSATSDYSSQNQDEYDLDLFLENNTMSGTYLLKSGGQQSGQGNATASKALGAALGIHYDMARTQILNCPRTCYLSHLGHA